MKKPSERKKTTFANERCFNVNVYATVTVLEQCDRQQQSKNIC